MERRPTCHVYNEIIMCCAIFLNLEESRSHGNERETGLVLGILNANRKIRKRTDTNVAFTLEYSRVSIFHRNVSVLIKIQDRPRITI